MKLLSVGVDVFVGVTEDRREVACSGEHVLVVAPGEVVEARRFGLRRADRMLNRKIN